MKPKFPNGFESWYETHHEVVGFITNHDEDDKGIIAETQNEQGTGGLYELARRLTDDFEKLNKGREWDGEFFDEIETFLNQELKIKE